VPRTFLAVKQHTISVAANDLLTILYQPYSKTSLFNHGPGNLWVSYQSKTPAAVGSESCLELAANNGCDSGDWTFNPADSGSMSMQADAASSLSITVAPGTSFGF